MQKQEIFFHSDKFNAHFLQYGNGPKIILAFHGFGQTGEVFLPIIRRLGDEYTFYCMNLPFHGETIWMHGEEPLEKQAWSDFIRDFLQSQGIQRFTLYGYSLGAKFALATVEGFPSRVDELVLIAPDGISPNFWYSLATSHSFLRWIFKSIIEKPGIFFNLLAIIKEMKMIDPGVTNFVRNQMDTLKKRQKVYHSWVVFRKLQFNMSMLASAINEKGIRVTFLMGEYDKIIRLSVINNFSAKLVNREIKILKTGHGSLIKRTADFFGTERISSNKR